MGEGEEGGGWACQSSLKLTCLHCDVTAMAGWGRGQRVVVCVGRVSSWGRGRRVVVCVGFVKLGAWPEGGGVCMGCVSSWGRGRRAVVVCQSSLKLTCLHCGVADMAGWGCGRSMVVCVGVAGGCLKLEAWPEGGGVCGGCGGLSQAGGMAGGRWCVWGV